jgi:RNA polymerase sigma factor (sigma-70 family)
MILYGLAVLNAEEKRSISKLYEANKGRLLTLAHRETCDWAMAEDAVQDVFLAVLSNEETRSKVLAMDETSFTRWITVVVRNKSRDIRDRENRRVGVPLDGMEASLQSGDEGIELRIIKVETYKKLMQHVDELDELSRYAIEMKYGLGMTIKEIAGQLRLSEAVANNTLARARAKLKSKLESEVRGNATA